MFVSFAPGNAIHIRAAKTRVKCIWYTYNLKSGAHRHIYRQPSNMNHTFVDNKIVDNSDVVEALPVGAAPTPALLYYN